MKSLASVGFSWKREVTFAKVDESGFHPVIIGSANSSVRVITESVKLQPGVEWASRDGEGEVKVNVDDLLGEKQKLRIPFRGIVDK